MPVDPAVFDADLAPHGVPGARWPDRPPQTDGVPRPARVARAVAFTHASSEKCSFSFSVALSHSKWRANGARVVIKMRNCLDRLDIGIGRE